MSKSKNKPTIHRPGKWNIRKGKQTFDTISTNIKDNDIIRFGGGIYQLNDYVNITNDITIDGTKGAIVLLPSFADKDRKGFNRDGFHFGGNNDITLRNIIFELEPETTAVNITKSYKGNLTIDNINTRHKRSLLYKDIRKDHPSIKVYGRGKLIITNSNLEFIEIDAPNMDIHIKKSKIGNYRNSSLLKGRNIIVSDTELNNVFVSAKAGNLSDINTKGGLVLEGEHSLYRTELNVIDAPQPERFPPAMTHMISMPGSKIYIEDILSHKPTKPPYYRHFDFRGSKVSIKGTEGLSEQLLKNIVINSKVRVKGGKWIKDPTKDDYLKEERYLKKAMNQ